MKKFVLLLILMYFPAYGIEQDKVAHLGVSYGIQMVTYGLAKNALNMDRIDSVVFSGFTTFLFSTAYKAATGGLRTSEGREDVLANVAGQGLAIGTILMFDF